MTKAIIPNRNVKRAKLQHKNVYKKVDNAATATGWSVGVTTDTQPVWLTGLRAKPSHSLQEPCNQKDTHLKKIVNKPRDIDNKPTATTSGDSDIRIGQAVPHQSGSKLRFDEG